MDGASYHNISQVEGFMSTALEPGMNVQQIPQERPVVICTKYRGVFFGYATDTSGYTVTLSHARMCVYWEQAIRGVLGLASHGPSSGCRIGNPVPQIELRGVTAVIEVTPEAAEKWEASPWS